MKVVADTGPINYLVLIGHSSLLPRLFPTVWIPRAVRCELEHTDAPLEVRRWIGAPPQWLLEEQVEPAWHSGLELLGNGERETIGLAQSLGADLVVMDDRLGVSSAQSRGLPATGTLGVLERGANRGWIDLADAFDRLRHTSFRVCGELLEAMLALARHSIGDRD